MFQAKKLKKTSDKTTKKQKLQNKINKILYIIKKYEKKITDINRKYQIKHL